MKKLMFAFAAMLGSVAFVNAQEASDNAVKAPETAVQKDQQDEKVKI
jgi:hypothetical protein